MRIGQILSRCVPLSDHDVEEILQEQKSTRLRFGDAALALGFVRPGDVWAAWCEQVATGGGEIDLAAIGIDAQATQCLPAVVAARFRVMPVRTSGNSVVIASARPLDDADRAVIESHAGRRVIFVRAPSGQIEAAVRRYYASAVPPATAA